MHQIQPVTVKDVLMQYGRKTLNQRAEEIGRTLKLDGAAWRKLRESVLNMEPLCRHCTARGLIVAASEVDHINNVASDNDPDNLQALCKSCHSRKTQADMGKRVALGCDVSGMPADPSHHWNKTPALLQKSPATEAGKPTGSPSFNATCLKNRQS